MLADTTNARAVVPTRRAGHDSAECWLLVQGEVVGKLLGQETNEIPDVVDPPAVEHHCLDPERPRSSSGRPPSAKCSAGISRAVRTATTLPRDSQRSRRASVPALGSATALSRGTKRALAITEPAGIPPRAVGLELSRRSPQMRRRNHAGDRHCSAVCHRSRCRRRPATISAMGRVSANGSNSRARASSYR